MTRAGPGPPGKRTRAAGSAHWLWVGPPSSYRTRRRSGSSYTCTRCSGGIGQSSRRCCREANHQRYDMHPRLFGGPVPGLLARLLRLKTYIHT